MLCVDYDFLWKTRTLYLCAERYLSGDALALQAYCIDDLREGDTDPWATLSVNLPHDPAASEWCRQPGHFALDTNNVSAELVRALVTSGVVVASDAHARSGWCDYPLVSVPRDKLELIPDGRDQMLAELESAGIIHPTSHDQGDHQDDLCQER